jgi:LemA protein
MEIIKKFWWVGLLGILVLWAISKYNGIAGRDQEVKRTWGDVESDYQRRSDLIPNLVSTVKGYADFEQKTLTDVIQARASATQVKIDPTNLTPEKLQEFQKAQSGISSALGRLLVVSENYPNLKANQNFLDLQAQLEGTENRISVSRKRFNEAVQGYNTAIVGFPGNLIAKLGGFVEKGFFQAAAGAEKAPEVKF